MPAVRAEPSAKQLLAAVKQLPPAELSRFKRQFANWQKKNGQPRRVETEVETELLARIHLNSRLPETAQRRFNRLRRKLEEETITEVELRDLQGLTSRLEWMSVERLEAVIELARLRGTDVDTLMRELGLLPKRHVSAPYTKTAPRG
jgi:hypothetical protein